MYYLKRNLRGNYVKKYSPCTFFLIFVHSFFSIIGQIIFIFVVNVMHITQIILKPMSLTAIISNTHGEGCLTIKLNYR